MKVLIIADTIERLGKSVPYFGGLERQVHYTAEYLNRAGIEADLKNVFWEGLSSADMARYDLVHIFNTGGPKGMLITAALLAREAGKKVIFTPVYWPPDKLLSEMEKHNCKPNLDMVQEAIKAPLGKLISLADVVVANAHSEWIAICLDLEIRPDCKPVFIVPNAIALEEMDTIVETPFKGKDYVLCVGRIEWRKNQHNLAEAMKILYCRGHQLGLLLAGAQSADAAFLNVLQRSLEGVQAAWIGQQPAPVIYGAMVSAKVYCQPSFYETPGLAALEAAALGVPLVTGSWGSEREYFGALAEYCIPNDPVSIADAIERALAADRVRWRTLSEAVKREFTYEAAVQKLKRIYQVLAQV